MMEVANSNRCDMKCIRNLKPLRVKGTENNLLKRLRLISEPRLIQHTSFSRLSTGDRVSSRGYPYSITIFFLSKFDFTIKSSRAKPFWVKWP
jgi:hypothetical protein